MALQFIDIPREETTGAGGKVFIKLDDGQSITGVIRGNPHTFRIHWPKGQKSIKCEGVGCPLCKAGDAPKFRFSINFLVQEQGKWVAKIFEQSGRTYGDLKTLQDTGYDLEKTPLMIKRSGKEKDTKYTLLPIPGKAISPQLEKVLETVELNNLAEGPKKLEPQATVNDDPFGSYPDQALPKSHPVNDDIPF